MIFRSLINYLKTTFLSYRQHYCIASDLTLFSMISVQYGRKKHHGRLLQGHLKITLQINVFRKLFEMFIYFYFHFIHIFSMRRFDPCKWLLLENFRFLTLIVILRLQPNNTNWAYKKQNICQMPLNLSDKWHREGNISKLINLNFELVVNKLEPWICFQ